MGVVRRTCTGMLASSDTKPRGSCRAYALYWVTQSGSSTYVHQVSSECIHSDCACNRTIVPTSGGKLCASYLVARRPHSTAKYPGRSARAQIDTADVETWSDCSATTSTGVVLSVGSLTVPCSTRLSVSKFALEIGQLRNDQHD